MKTIYLECKMGASGDMLMGALFELLPDREEFLAKMNSLGLSGIAVTRVPAVHCGITGSHMRVTIGGAEESAFGDEHGGNHEHTHADHTHEHTHPDHTHEHTHPDHANEHTHPDHTHEHMHSDHTHEHTHADHANEHAYSDHAHEHAHPDHAHEHAHPDHAHEHTHPDHTHFSYSDIQSLIEALPVSDMVKSDALAVYRLIGDAESAVHGVPVTQIHFHEVGSLDAVADVVGVSVLAEMLGTRTIIASPVCTGGGTVRCAHGVLPVPAPATARLLLGIPCFNGEIESELCTPTGAALLRHFAANFGGMPPMRIERIGYGMGTKDFPTANCVRAFLGESAEEADPHNIMSDEISSAELCTKSSASHAACEDHGDPQGGATDEVYEICCNLDDMTPEAVGYACELLLREGALDTFTVPIQMKKSRLGTLLCCLCKTEDRQKFTRLILLHTTTLGVRSRRCERCILTSSHTVSETEYGKIRVKISEGYGVHRAKPEYDDVKAAAERCGVSFEAVSDAAIAGIN